MASAPAMNRTAVTGMGWPDPPDLVDVLGLALLQHVARPEEQQASW